MKHTKERSDNLDDYIEEMYKIEKLGKRITTKELAERLHVKMSSVTEMLDKLKKGGFIKYEKRKLIELKDDGKKLGKELCKKHEILKKFFLWLGVSEEEAEDQACRIEHDISKNVIKKLEKLLKEGKKYE